MRNNRRLGFAVIVVALAVAAVALAGKPMQRTEKRSNDDTSAPELSAISTTSSSTSSTAAPGRKLSAVAPVGLYVWPSEFDVTKSEDRTRLVNDVQKAGISFLYLSNYEGGGDLKMPDHASLRKLLAALSDVGCTTYATYTEWNKKAGAEWNFFALVAEFNARSKSAKERFVGIAMDWEGGGEDRLDPVRNPEHWGEMYTEAKKHGLKLHLAIRSWWKPKTFRIAIDNSDSVHVMAYSNRCTASDVIADELEYASTVHKPLYVALETKAVDHSPTSPQPDETLAAHGETALLDCIKKTKANAPAVAGFVIHHYRNSWAKGTAAWPQPK